MAAVLVGQFHARDAEGRIYPIHQFQEAAMGGAGDDKGALTVSYRLAHGDRVNHIADDRFVLAQSGIELVREP